MAAQFVIDALMMALWRRGKPTQLMHHSDQGSQVASEDLQRLLADQGITLQHESARRVLGLCGDGELLLDAED